MKNDVHVKYLISNSKDDSWGLTVSTVGYQQILPNTEYPPQDHPKEYLFSTHKGRVLDEYILLYIAHGNGSFSSSTKKNIKLQAGTAILLFPDEWHNYKPIRSDGWDEYWIGFKGYLMEKRVQNGFFNKQKELFYVGPSMEIIQLYKSAINIAKEQKAGYQQVLAGIAGLLLGITYSQDKDASFGQTDMLYQINKAKMIIFESLHTNINLEDIANQICMSYSWFRHVFKKYTGLSPYQYILELRIEKSKELLITTTLTSQEIAYKVGYEDPMHFGIIFKKKTGFSPIKYRNLFQNQNT